MEMQCEVCEIPCEVTPKGSFWGGVWARLTRIDFIVVYLSLFILAILLIAVVYYGSGTDWYLGLNQSSINPWIPRVGWVIATILSYGASYLLWQDVRVVPIPRDLILSVLFVITGFLFLAWGVALYYAQDIALSIWITLALFIYNYWLFIYVWNINKIAALFLIPNLILYGYLVYSSVNFASINDVPI